MNITVIDAPPGAGKTTWALSEINRNPDTQYVYVTPFLDEVDRVIEATAYEDGSRRFQQPTYRGSTKIDDFNRLLREGNDIAATHSTLANADEFTEQHLRDGNYCLILDEVFEVFKGFNDICDDRQSVNAQDFQMLQEGGFIATDDTGRVSWISDSSYEGGKFSDLERMARRGNIVWVDGSLLWEFPIQILESVQEIILMTYMFEGSLLKPFFDCNGISYEMKTVQRLEDGSYALTDLVGEATGEAYSDLIDLYLNSDSEVKSKINDYKKNTLTKTWFSASSGRGETSKRDKNLSKERCDRISGDIYNYVHNIVKAKSKQILWTCPKDVYGLVKGEGFTETRKPTEDERKLSPARFKKLKNDLLCWQPLNTKATNKFKDRDVVIYAYDMRLSPVYKHYFEARGVSVNEDAFSLSCMLQFIWRSAIRDGKKIQLYVPSTRMRNLLLKWLGRKPEPKVKEIRKV